MRKYTHTAIYSPSLALGILLALAPAKEAPAGVTVTPVTTAPAAPASGSGLPDKILPSTPASSDLAAQLAAAGRYNEAIQVISRLLQMDPVRGQYDRQAMMLLRADCQIHLKQMTSAIETLESVRAVAQKAADRDEEATATALKALLQASPTFHYIPSTGPSKVPLDIIDPAGRNAALNALYSDQLAQLQAKLADGKTSGSVKGMLEIARTAHLVRALATATHSDIHKIDDSLKKLPELAAQRIRDAIEDWDKAARSISSRAGRFERRQTGVRLDSFGTHPVYTDGRVGLSAQDATDLQNIQSACDQVPEVVADLVSAFGNPEAYNGRMMRVEARAADCKRRASDVLKTDYSR